MTFSDISNPVDAVVFGASGGLGSAFVEVLSQDPAISTVHAVSRRPIRSQAGIISHTYTPDESGIERLAGKLPQDRLGLAIVTLGTLHDEDHGPEKSIRQFTSERFLDVMRINAGLPALIGKALMPSLKRQPMTFAALSARVGSISDNRLGGWHSYRASKAALNMLIRNIALEAGRTNPEAVCVTLHPGTVDTALSKPFQANVPESKLFTTNRSATALLKTLRRLTPAHSGKCFDYAGKEISP